MIEIFSPRLSDESHYGAVVQTALASGSDLGPHHGFLLSSCVTLAACLPSLSLNISINKMRMTSLWFWRRNKIKGEHDTTDSGVRRYVQHSDWLRVSPRKQWPFSMAFWMMPRESAVDSRSKIPITWFYDTSSLLRMTFASWTSFQPIDGWFLELVSFRVWPLTGCLSLVCLLPHFMPQFSSL